MIQAHYLQSDFDPKILILGEQRDFKAIHNFFETFLKAENFDADLNQFNVHQTNFQMNTHKSCSEGKGLYGEDNALTLELNNEQIEHYLNEIEDFLALDSQAGSCILDLLIIDEVRIQLSFGEFDQDYFKGL